MARAVLLVAGLALAAIALLYAVTTWVVRSESDAALQRSVDVEIAALADIFATGGQGELAKRLADRLTMRASDGDQSHYMLADASGGRIAGDSSRWMACYEQFLRLKNTADYRDCAAPEDVWAELPHDPVTLVRLPWEGRDQSRFLSL